jgi:hypothetical protein
MAYIGNPPANRFVAPKAATQFSGDGSTTAFTLDHAVGSDEDILVSVDGVIQEPSVAYAVSNGTTLTFTAAPSSNSGNNIFVYYLFRTVGTVSHPSNNALSATSGTFTGDVNVTGNVISNDGSNVARFQFDNDNQMLIINDTDMRFLVGGNTNLKIDSNGHVTKPNQPAFLVQKSSTQTNVSTGTTVTFGSEIVDRNGDFASNTFTAPVTGLYQLQFIARIDQLDTDANWTRFQFITSNRTYESNILDPGVFSSDPAYWNWTIAVLADMDANDTVYVNFQQDGGSNQVDITQTVFFSGYLVA